MDALEEPKWLTYLPAVNSIQWRPHPAFVMSPWYSPHHLSIDSLQHSSGVLDSNRIPSIPSYPLRETNGEHACPRRQIRRQKWTLLSPVPFQLERGYQRKKDTHIYLPYHWRTRFLSLVTDWYRTILYLNLLPSFNISLVANHRCIQKQ